jgi:hypothetical protein
MAEQDDAVAGEDERQATREVCRVDITAPGLSISRTLPLRRLPGLLDFLLRRDGDERPAPTESAATSGPPASAGDLVERSAGGAADLPDDAAAWRQGLVAYYRDKRPATNPEKIAVFARFLEVAERRTFFHRDDIRRRFAVAGVALPRNFSRDLATALRRGYLVPLSDGRTYQVGSRYRPLIDRDGPTLLPQARP